MPSTHLRAPTKMFALRKTSAAPGLKGVVIARSTSPLAADDVRLRPLYAGICGTDMHIYQWDAWAQGRVRPPLTTGHEFVGEITAVGASSTYKIGQIVSAECHIVCNTCPLCRTGQAHLCPKTEIIGVDRDGAFCEELTLPQGNLWAISPQIATKHAAIFDPLGNAMHTVTTHNVSGEHVLITGAGAIGLAAIAMAKAYGAACVSVVEPNFKKHALAQTLGADHTFPTAEEALPFFTQNPPTVFFEMSGHPLALQAGLQALQFGGKAALLGLPAKPVTFDLAQLVIFKGVTLSGVIGRRMFDTWQRVDTFVKQNPHVPEALISHTVPAQAFQHAFDALLAGEATKAVLDFTNL